MWTSSEICCCCCKCAKVCRLICCLYMFKCETTCMLLCRLMLSTLRLSMTQLHLHLLRLLPLPLPLPWPLLSQLTLGTSLEDVACRPGNQSRRYMICCLQAAQLTFAKFQLHSLYKSLSCCQAYGRLQHVSHKASCQRVVVHKPLGSGSTSLFPLPCKASLMGQNMLSSTFNKLMQLCQLLLHH